MSRLQEIEKSYKQFDIKQIKESPNRPISEHSHTNISYADFCRKYSMYGNKSYVNDCKTS